MAKVERKITIEKFDNRRYRLVATTYTSLDTPKAETFFDKINNFLNPRRQPSLEQQLGCKDCELRLGALHTDLQLRIISNSIERIVIGCHYIAEADKSRIAKAPCAQPGKTINTESP